MAGSADKINYKVQGINQFTDPNDTIQDGGIQRPKRKTLVTLCPESEGSTGAFQALNVPSPGPVAGMDQSPIITLTFVEHTGVFPWTIGQTLTLSS